MVVYGYRARCGNRPPRAHGGANPNLYYSYKNGAVGPDSSVTNDDNPKQIASLSGFTPYGWYGDSYILLSQNSSELYTAPADLSSSPVKITDGHKPSLAFNGSGGGYGGQ